MFADLLEGKRLEVESLNGTVVRLGREQGVSTPLNFAVYAAPETLCRRTAPGTLELAKKAVPGPALNLAKFPLIPSQGPT